jgi:hypothetical protein
LWAQTHKSTTLVRGFSTPKQCQQLKRICHLPHIKNQSESQRKSCTKINLKFVQKVNWQNENAGKIEMVDFTISEVRT